MKTSAERQAEFLADLHALLRKHGAEISIEDRPHGYYTEGVATVEMDSIWTVDECVAEFTGFDLPRGISAKDKGEKS